MHQNKQVTRARAEKDDGESPVAREELLQLPGLLLIPNPITDRACIITKTVLMIFSISRPKRLRVFHGIGHGTRTRGHGVGAAGRANGGKISCASGMHLPGLWPLNELSFQFYGLLQIFPDVAPAVPVKEFLTDALSRV